MGAQQNVLAHAILPTHPPRRRQTVRDCRGALRLRSFGQARAQGLVANREAVLAALYHGQQSHFGFRCVARRHKTRDETGQPDGRDALASSSFVSPTDIFRERHAMTDRQVRLERIGSILAGIIAILLAGAIVAFA